MAQTVELAVFERRTAIYNAICDLHGVQADSSIAWTAMQQLFPDITRDEFLRAAKTFSRVAPLVCAHAEEGELFTPEVESQIDAIVAATRAARRSWSTSSSEGEGDGRR
jgi:hypothetical protein